jgi:hypothetical protein
MRVKETTLENGTKILILTLNPSEIEQIANSFEDKTVVRYWFYTVENDTEYNVRIDVDWSRDGTV